MAVDDRTVLPDLPVLPRLHADHGHPDVRMGEVLEEGSLVLQQEFRHSGQSHPYVFYQKASALSLPSSPVSLTLRISPQLLPFHYLLLRSV